MTAASWQTALLNKLYFVANSQRVNFDFCMTGMRSTDVDGMAPVEKRTRIITNSPQLVDELKKYKCDGLRRHVVLTDG